MMSALLLSISLLLGVALQVAPADTARPASDTQTVVLLPADSARLTPVPVPPGVIVPTLMPLPQEAPPDTATAATPAASDTLSATATPGGAPPDTTTTQAERSPGALFEDVGRDVGREVERFQRGLGAQVEQLRNTLTVSRLLLAVLALAISYVFIALVMVLLERLARWRPPQAYRLRRVAPLLKFGLWFAAIWIIVGGLFAGSGLALALLIVLVIGAVMAAGFPFLRDLAGGLVLTFEQPFQLGSRVRVGDYTGVVKRIGLRAFELATPDGSAVVVPNAEVLHRAVFAAPAETLEAPVSVELAVPETVDPDTARAVVREAAYASPYLCVAQPVTVVLQPPTPGVQALRMRIEAHVFDARHGAVLVSDITRQVQRAFGAVPASPGLPSDA